MRPKPTIRKFIAAFLLALCLFSFLPKSYFHDALAKHKDTVSCSHPEKETGCIHPQGFHCAFTDLVVTALYTATLPQPEIIKLFFHLTHNQAYHKAAFSTAFFCTDGRGPPTQAA